MQASYKNRVDNEDARPPRTFAAQQKLAKSGDSKENNVAIAGTLDEAAKSGDAPLKLRALKAGERKEFAQRGQEIQKFRKERQGIEAQAAVGTDEKTADTPAKEPAKLKLSRSPIAAKADAKVEGDLAPPKAPELPKVDAKAKATARATSASLTDTPVAPWWRRVSNRPRVQALTEGKGRTSQLPAPKLAGNQ